MEIIQTTAQIRSARIVRGIQETRGDLLSLIFSGKQSVNTGVKNSHRSYNNKSHKKGLEGLPALIIKYNII